MIKYSSLCVFFFLVFTSLGQKEIYNSGLKDYKNAKVSLAIDDQVKAKEKLLSAAKTISPVAYSLESVSDFQMLKLMGDIHLELNVVWSGFDGDESFNAAVESKKAYRRANLATGKLTEHEEIDAQMKRLQSNTFNQALAEHSKSNFNVANNFFIFSMELAELRNEVNEQQLYATAMSCEMVRDYEKAYNYYRRCVELDFGDSKFYTSMLNCAALSGNYQWVKNTIYDGTEKFPNDQDFRFASVNAYLTINDYRSAKRALLYAIDKDPANSSSLYFTLGSVYEQLNEITSAIESYEAALKIDPDYFEANYNLGALFFNDAIEIQNKMNLADFNDPGLAELSQSYNLALSNSRKHLEKAYDLNPKDYLTVSALSSLYGQIGLTDKYTQMKVELERIKNGN